MKLFRNCIILWILAVAFVFCASRCHAQFLRSGVMVSVATKPAGSVPAVNSLRSGLIAYYKFDESYATNTAADSHTNNKTLSLGLGSPPVVAGLLNNGRSGNRNTYLEQNSSAMFATGSNGFTVSFWTSINTIPNVYTEGIVGKNATTNRAWGVYILTDKTMYYQVSSNGTDAVTLLMGATAVSNTWYHIVFRHDPTNQVLKARRSTTASEGSDISTNCSPYMWLSTAKFQFGQGSTGGTSRPSDAKIDECAVWNRCLTDAECTVLWNSGAPFPYASFQ